MSDVDVFAISLVRFVLISCGNAIVVEDSKRAVDQFNPAELVRVFNNCVHLLTAFRNKHIEIVAVYILAQSRNQAKPEEKEMAEAAKPQAAAPMSKPAPAIPPVQLPPNSLAAHSHAHAKAIEGYGQKVFLSEPVSLARAGLRGDMHLHTAVLQTIADMPLASVASVSHTVQHHGHVGASSSGYHSFTRVDAVRAVGPAVLAPAAAAAAHPVDKDKGKAKDVDPDNPHGEVGTGGTTIMPFLQSARNETSNAYVV